jgi:hypothetical protein
MLPAGGSRMEWTLRLVGTEMDGQSRSFDVMEISRLPKQSPAAELTDAARDNPDLDPLGHGVRQRDAAWLLAHARRRKPGLRLHLPKRT